MLAVEKEEAQGEADQQVIAVLEAAATTAAQLEATERSLAQAEAAKAEAEQLVKRQVATAHRTSPSLSTSPSPSP